MSTLLPEQEVEQQFDQLAQSGAYAEALELITREQHIFPEPAQKVVYYWRVWMACCLKEKGLALQLLQDAVNAGYWYGGLKNEPDFELLYGDAEFERLANICDDRRAEAMANAAPVIKITQPEAQYSPYPLLLALHGGNANIAADHWSSAVEHGWLVALPQSSQVYAPNNYTWNDWEWAQNEVVKHYIKLLEQYPIDPQRVVLAGFSQGGGLALWLALTGAIQARGLVLVGPFLPNVNGIIPLMEKHDPGGLQVYLVAGQRDRYCLGVAKQLAAILPQYGVICHLDEYSDLEHSFPKDFGKKLPDALDFVTM